MKVIEYYVRYTDTRGTKISSSNFLTKERAEEFAKSMLAQGASEALVKTFEYYR